MVTVGSSSSSSFSQQNFGWSPGGGSNTLLSQAMSHSSSGGKSKRKNKSSLGSQTTTTQQPQATPPKIPEGMTRTSRSGQEVYRGGKWEVTKPYSSGAFAQTGQTTQSKDIVKMWGSRIKDTGNVFTSNLKETVKAGGYVDIPANIDFFNLKRIGYGTSLQAVKNREAMDQDILRYNTESELFAKKQENFMASGNLIKTPGGGYAIFDLGTRIEYEKLEKERGVLSSMGETLGQQYGLALEKEKTEKEKTFESRWITRIEEPFAEAITRKVLKRDQIFSESFRAGYNRAMPLSGEVDLGIAQAIYSSVRDKPVGTMGLVGIGFVSGPVFGTVAKGATWFGKKVPMSFGVGSKTVTSSQVISFGIKSTPYILGGTYAAGKIYELFSAETQFEKGQVIGRGIVEAGAVGLGAGIYRGIKVSQSRKAFLLEAERSPLKVEPSVSFVKGKDVITFQKGTQRIFGRDYGIVVQQYGILQKGGYQTIKGSKLVSYGYQGDTAKLVQANLFSQSQNIGSGQFKKTGDFFKSLFGKKDLKISTSYSKVTPTSVKTYTSKGDEIWNIFGQRLNPSYSRSIGITQRTGKNTFNFVSVKADKLSIWKTGKTELIGNKFPTYGSGRIVKIKGATSSVGVGDDLFSFVYNKKTGTWFNPKEWKPNIKVTKISPTTQVTTQSPFDVTSIPPRGSVVSSWSKTKKMFSPMQQLTTVEIAPTYVGGQGKQPSLFAGTGGYESSISSFIGGSYAPTVTGLAPGGMKGLGLIGGFDFKEKWKSTPSHKDTFINFQSPNVRTSFIPIQPVIQAQPIKTITKTGQGLRINQLQIIKSGQIQEPIIPIPVTPTFIPQMGFFKAPPIFGMPKLPSASFGSSFNLFGRTKRRGYKYQPSMTAILFGIKGKPSKSSVTGFSIRPIPIYKSKRRKK